MVPSRARNPKASAWRRAGTDRGSATIQMVVLLPALFTLMFLGVQAALLYQARAVCLAAAQEGARAAAAEHSTGPAGIAVATGFVQSSSTGVDLISVTGQRSATEATVTVQATSLSVLPGWTPTITQSASMPVERITG